MEKAVTYKDYLSTGNNIKLYVILFLIWPFLAFLLAIKNYSSKEAKRVVYLYLIYYGLTFVVGELGGAGSDSERYAINFMRLANSESVKFSDLFKNLYSTDDSVDFVDKIIRYVLSRFTSYYGILFMVYAAIFGFFYLKSIDLLHDRYRKMPNLNAQIFLIFFVTILPISAINGFRMWTAAWIFFYGTYHVVLYKNYKFLFLALLAPLVHWSFISADILLVIFIFAGNRNNIYLPLSIISFIIPHLIEPVLQLIFGKLGGALRDRADTYYNENYILARQETSEQVVWFMQITNNLLLYYFFFLLVMIFFRYREKMSEPYEKNLFSFILLLLTFVNFAKVVPSFGDRFQVLFFLFSTLYVLMFSLKQHGNRIELTTLVGLFPLLLSAAISFRQFSDSFNVWILTPGLGLPLLLPGISLASILF